MRLPAPRAVLFDLDGTLLDTLDDIATALGRALRAHGHAAPAPDAVRRMVGDGARVLVARALATSLDAPEVAAVHATFLAMYAEDPTPATRSMDGASELLDLLASRGVRSVVCTNKPAAIARTVVARTLGDRVMATVGGGDAPRLKPHPDLVHAALAVAGVAPREAWLVGDGEQDVLAARAAGVASVGYLAGFGSAERLHAAAPDVVVSSFAELRQLFAASAAR